MFLEGRWRWGRTAFGSGVEEVVKLVVSGEGGWCCVGVGSG